MLKYKLLPDPREYPGNRLFCLDMLRGLDMFYLAVGTTFLAPFFKAAGASPQWVRFFCSHPWEGFTLYDLIMPLFIFMCGAAIPFALRGRMGADGRPTCAFHRHVWSRAALLWVLGMLAQGGLQTLNWKEIWLYSNTLQTIAVGYVVAAYVLLLRSWTLRIAVPMMLTVAYGLIVHFGGDYSLDWNVTIRVERVIVGALMPADNVWVKALEPGAKYGYTWFLPSMMFPVIALAGAFSTEILRSASSKWKRAAALFAFGVGLLSIGWILAFAGVKMVKHIFTVSFTLQAIGWSVLALDALFVICDILKFRRGTGLMLLYGQFALCAYLCEAVFRKACFMIGERLCGGLVRFFPAAWSDVVLAVMFGLVVTFVMIVWRGFKAAK